MSRKKTDYAPHVAPEKAPACHITGCAEPGAYKAPKSREELHDYLWFCLEHVRDHNKQWDYFAGLGSEEIEDFIKDSVTGHRPTWDRESRVRQRYNKLQDALYEFLSAGVKRPAPSPQLSGKIRKALSQMDMQYPYTAKELKIQYRALVKKHHPDVNKGNKQSEETFKLITTAYQHLAEHIKG
jgi:hypothetical protein